MEGGLEGRQDRASRRPRSSSIERGQRRLRGAGQGRRCWARPPRPTPQLKGIAFETITDGQQQDPAAAAARQEHRLRRRRRADRVDRLLAGPAGRPVQAVRRRGEERQDGRRKHPGYMAHAVRRQGRRGRLRRLQHRRARATSRGSPTAAGSTTARRKRHIDFLHSFDGGKTWTKSYTLTDTTPPWDMIHYETVDDIPAGHALGAVSSTCWNATAAGPDACSLYAVRMEADYQPADTAFKPLEVTFTWNERQEDYSLVTRSHTQLVEKLPVHLHDQRRRRGPSRSMDSLTVNLAGGATRPSVKYGYSDGKDAGGEKFADRWVTYGKNLAEGKPYTCTVPVATRTGAPATPTARSSPTASSARPTPAAAPTSTAPAGRQGDKPVVTVDLGKAEKCGAFRIQIGGYPFWDAIKGEVKDKVEVLTSRRRQGVHQPGLLRLQPALEGHPGQPHVARRRDALRPNYLLIPPKPVEARYVRFDITPARFLSVSEVQVLDFIKYEPFDLKIALPDGKDRSDITQYPAAAHPLDAAEIRRKKGFGSSWVLGLGFWNLRPKTQDHPLWFFPHFPGPEPDFGRFSAGP